MPSNSARINAVKQELMNLKEQQSMKAWKLQVARRVIWKPAIQDVVIIIVFLGLSAIELDQLNATVVQLAGGNPAAMSIQLKVIAVKISISTNVETGRFCASLDVPQSGSCIHTRCGYLSTLRIETHTDLETHIHNAIGNYPK